MGIYQGVHKVKAAIQSAILLIVDMYPQNALGFRDLGAVLCCAGEGLVSNPNPQRTNPSSVA